MKHGPNMFRIGLIMVWGQIKILKMKEGVR